jgi:hypothetical protein
MQINGVEDDVWRWELLRLGLFLTDSNRAPLLRLWFFEQPNQIPRCF